VLLPAAAVVEELAVEAAAVEAAVDEAVLDAEDDVEDCAKGEESASCDRVTKSCWAAERLPLLRSLPS
jgi:hypothetical protein